ncbi:hypothetical protein VTI74DRAFT_7756 [Chaetomium olivicolor]
MSGSGGFYKYPCKYRYTYNCPNWVYANGHACPMCLAEGREAVDNEPPKGWQQQQQQQHQQHEQHQQYPFLSTEICVPQAVHGTLRYTVMEIIPTEEGGPGRYWVLRQRAMEPPALPYSTITTSDTPRPVMGTTGPHMGY